ncbi:transcriptional cofactor Bfc [Drosophila takahashii]|uniref:transcriptional cofactor Bfc n=1 Tax=Drosophila takahashii TaxID=29030 RepID=UPI003898EB6F
MDKAEKPSRLSDNFLYMLEFVIDDLLITRPNLCAPEEYPTCTEITFRSIFLNIRDRENGECVNPCSPKCGKCTLFTLDSPITDEDVMHIQVYKKRTEDCKFLLGLAELPMKPIFDRVKKEFDFRNINWEENVMTHVSGLPKIRGPCKRINACVTCYEKHRERREQWCPTSELTKRMLPLFNLCKMQTGNIVLILRLVCNGPSVVTSFPVQPPKCKDPCCTGCCSGCCPPDPIWPAPCPSPFDPCDPCKSIKNTKKKA